MVKYSYDAYGNSKGYTGSSGMGLGTMNPFRYKGYYYDLETNMYYCKSRYYVPEWCRWLNGDSVGYLNPQSINGMNLFAYCNNNPVMRIDPTGHFGILVGLIIGAIIGRAIKGAINAYESSRALNKNGWETFGWTLSGLFVGNAGVVAANWDQVIQQSDWGYMEDKGFCNFDYRKNPHYSLWTSLMFSSYMKKEFYSDDGSRSIAGIHAELLVHFVLFNFGNEHGVNGAWIQKFDPTPRGVIADFDALGFEIMSMVMNPILYFFR